MNSKLSPIELAILKEVINCNISDYPSLKDHLLYIYVSNRECTVVGYYINFEYKENCLPKFNIDNLLFGNKSLFIEGFPHEITYALVVTNGQITQLEIVSNVYEEDAVFDRDLALYKFKFVE